MKTLLIADIAIYSLTTTVSAINHNYIEMIAWGCALIMGLLAFNFYSQCKKQTT